MMASWVPILVSVVGGTVAYLLMRRQGWTARSSAAWAAVAAPGLGFGLVSVAYFFWIFAGQAPPGRWTLIGLSAFLALVLLLVGGRRRRDAEPAASEPATTREESSNDPGWRGQRAALVAIALAGLVGLGWLLSIYPAVSEHQPFGGWDAKAIWNVRALFLFRADGNLGEIYAGLEDGHPDYPLFLPSALAGQYSLLGREDLAIPAMTGLLFTLAAGGALFMAARHLATTAVAVAAVAVYWATPVVWRWAFIQYADIPLSYGLLMTVVALSSQLDPDPSRRLPPVLTGFFLGLLSWTKNEGAVHAGLVTSAFLLLYAFAWRQGRADLRRLPWIAAGALPVVSALVLFKSYWSPVNETARFLLDDPGKAWVAERWLTVAKAFLGEFAPWSGAITWGWLWPALALCGIVFWRQRLAGGLPFRLFDASLLLVFTLSVMAYILTPVGNLQWHLDTSLKRLLLQMTPLAIAWAVAGVGRSERATL